MFAAACSETEHASVRPRLCQAQTSQPLRGLGGPLAWLDLVVELWLSTGFSSSRSPSSVHSWYGSSLNYAGAEIVSGKETQDF
jgi:hypothetical protein